MDTNPDTRARTSANRIGPWGWQRRAVVGILLAIGLFFAVALPLVAPSFVRIPLGLVFIVLAIAVTVWWPRPSARDKAVQ